MGRQVLVVATKTGYRLGRRYRPGREFYVDEAALYRRDREGKPVLDVKGNKIPVSWYEPVKEEKPKQLVREDPAKGAKGSKKAKADEGAGDDPFDLV